MSVQETEVNRLREAKKQSERQRERNVEFGAHTKQHRQCLT